MSRISDLLATGINPQEKLNHLIYLPRLIQSGSGAKHGYQKLLRKTRSLKQNLDGHFRHPGGFVEFGCGTHDPMALAVLHYLNGYGRCHAIDLMKPRNETYSALSMYDIVTNIRCFPERYCFNGTSEAEILKRADRLNLAAFEAGDFWGGFEGVRDEVCFESADILESTIDEESISLVASFAVLEHVDNLDAICDRLRRVMRPGGMAFHFVDLADHRSYRKVPQFNSFTFLTEKHAPSGMNRLRANEIVEAHRRHEFEILRDNRQTETMPEETRQRLLPRFRRMRMEDVSAIKQTLVVRRT